MLLDRLRPYMDSQDNKREIRKLNKIVGKINALEPEIKALSDEELREKTNEFKERLKNNESLDSILPEAYAVVREASSRILGMRHFDVQLMGGIILHQGRIAEMKTGEGKTLVATLPVYLNALTGKGVHVVTANEYLAKRDSAIMGELYRFLGLTVGTIYARMDQEERKAAYQMDITYGTNNEFGFDYLRDNMAKSTDRIVQRKLHYALVDEVDSILIDEARTPLIIAGEMIQDINHYQIAAAVILKLTPDADYEVDMKEKRATLTESGVKKVEELLGIENMADESNMELAHYINNALRAQTLMKKDVDYVVKNDEIIIVDAFTGRLMHGRRFNDGMHQAIEAKENVGVQKETRILASITFQNYFRMYEKLSGMTGTAKTEEDEFKSIYAMDVVPIPTNKPILRKDLPDMVYRTEQGKFYAITDKVEEIHKTGQPVLIGTVSIEISELLSSEFKKRDIPHTVLNAKYHEQEAEIVAKAGEKGAVTIATNMAGRGTDIKLGEGVAELGGLYIIGTERHESRRIDNQLRGRSGRQGDPGCSQFYLSVEDTLMKRFCTENLTELLDKLGIDDNLPLENKMITKSIESAQKRVETNNFEIRKHVLEYDDVMNKQREVIYNERNKVLYGKDIHEDILYMANVMIENIITDIQGENKFPEQWDLDQLEKELLDLFSFEIKLDREKIPTLTKEDIADDVKHRVKEHYEKHKTFLGAAPFGNMERETLLKQVDKAWRDHLDDMEELKRGIGLRAYAQKKPIQEYQFEAFEMFNHLTWTIQRNTIQEVFRAIKVIVNNMNTPQTIKIAPKRIEINLG